MVIPQLKALESDSLGRPQLPPDPENCSIPITASIGAKGTEGEELFFFRAVTPLQVAELGLPRWGRGLLVVERFSWEAVDRAVERLLASASRETWGEVAQSLNQYLEWEYDGYRNIAG